MFKDKLNEVPKQPGCYQMYNKDNVIINNNTYTWDKVGKDIPVESNGIVTNYNVWMNSKITTAPCTIKVVV